MDLAVAGASKANQKVSILAAEKSEWLGSRTCLWVFVEFEQSLSKSQGPIMWRDPVPRQYRAGSQVR